MGDRGVISIVRDRKMAEAPVCLYSHWDGTGLADVLKRSLGKRWRWTDPPYLARIIFDEMVGGQQGRETGYGIYGLCPSVDHPVLLVETSTQLVYIAATTLEPISGGMPFPSFVDMPFDPRSTYPRHYWDLP